MACDACSLFHSVVLLDAAPQTAPAHEGGFEQTFVMLALALFFFYFIMWRPEKKRRKEMDAKRSALKKGDPVVISGGILCEIDRMEQDTAIVKLYDGAKMEVLKGAIQDVVPPKGSKEESK